MLIKQYFCLCAVIGSIIFFLNGCGPTFLNLAQTNPQKLLAMEDSLLIQRPEDSELKEILVSAHLNLARQGGDIVEYERILKLDPAHAEARYYISMDKGQRLFKKGSDNELWDALVHFGKAAAVIDTLGEPHYWMAKCYEKKDEMDFELALEAYNKALNLYVPDSLLSSIKKDQNDLLKRKAVFDDFWK